MRREGGASEGGGEEGGGRDGGREGGRGEGGRKGGREEGRERGREGGRERGREGAWNSIIIHRASVPQPVGIQIPLSHQQPPHMHLHPLHRVRQHSP